MIRYRLKCEKRHEFEAWFADSVAYDGQAKRREISCPKCGNTRVEKALMAPAIAKRTVKRKRAAKSAEPASAAQQAAQAQSDTHRLAAHGELAAAMRKMRTEVEAKSEYVGPRFPEEARKIHYDEAPARGIYGEATHEEAQALAEEGIEFFPSLPCPRTTTDGVRPCGSDPMALPWLDSPNRHRRWSVAARRDSVREKST